MRKAITVRLLSTIPVVLGVVIVAFFALRVLPGDPVDIMATEMMMSAEDMARLREQFGLNDPLYIQFFDYVSDLTRLNMGRSMFNNRPVVEQLAQQLPATIELTIGAMVVALLIGLPLGVLAAIYRDTWIDRLSMVIALTGVSMPSFWMGIMLIWLFGVTLRWLPISGTGSLQHLVLPALALGSGSAAIIARLVRSSMLEVLGQEYITTARAKGLKDSLIIVRHALPNALIPTVTVLGLQVGSLLGGAVVIEIVFTRKGIGTLLIRAVTEQDFPVVQGGVFLVAMVYILVNLIVDLTYAYLDPRIRYQ